MKKTKNGITFNQEEIEIIGKALHKAYEFEKEKGHLNDSDEYLHLHNLICIALTIMR